KRVFLVILFTSFSGSLVSRIPGAVHLFLSGNSSFVSIYIDGRDCCQTGQFSQDVADGALTQQWREGKLLLPSSESPQLLPVTLDAAAEQPESLAEDPETLSISCEVTFRHGTLRFNGNVSEKLLTLLIQELKR
ncbi:hypothetical protein MOO37_24330, partial [Escherichia coli]|nr:hypothetical protein [Escherichia coli]MCJ8454257.1 hypothetical protein [Escherichia coli]